MLNIKTLLKGTSKLQHLQINQSLTNIDATKLYNHIIQSEAHSLKLNYGGYDKNDTAYDFSLICPNGLYRGNYKQSSSQPSFIKKIV